MAIVVWAREAQLSALGQPRGMGWGGGQEERDMYVLAVIHAVVWQKLTQYCKAIILQLKILKSFYKRTIFVRADIRHY